MAERPARTGGSRRKARKRAVDVLFEAALTGRDPVDVLARRRTRAAGEPPLSEYAVALVEGVAAHRDEIDDVLAEASPDWPLARMAVVDRQVLRVGAHELLHREDVPPGVAVAEAVELAAELSTADSPRFVNGVLGRLARERAGERAAPGAGGGAGGSTAPTGPTTP